MPGQRAMRPRLCTFEIVIVRVEVRQVDRKFPPRDELIKESILLLPWGFRLFYRERDRDWADVAEMKIWGEAACPIEFRMVAIARVVRQLVLQESFEPPKRLFAPALPDGNRLHGAVEIPPVGQVAVGRE